jgi:hypothetical protein
MPTEVLRISLISTFDTVNPAIGGAIFRVRAESHAANSRKKKGRSEERPLNTS